MFAVTLEYVEAPVDSKMQKLNFKKLLVLRQIILLFSLHHVMAIKHDPPIQLFNGIVLTGKESLQTLTLQLVSSSSWNRGLLPPTKKSSAVSCGHACTRMNNQKPHSCNALIFTEVSGDFQLGIATLASGYSEKMESVYVLQGHSGEQVTQQFGTRFNFHIRNCNSLCKQKDFLDRLSAAVNFKFGLESQPLQRWHFFIMFSKIYILTNMDV